MVSVLAATLTPHVQAGLAAAAMDSWPGCRCTCCPMCHLIASLLAHGHQLE